MPHLRLLSKGNALLNTILVEDSGLAKALGAEHITPLPEKSLDHDFYRFGIRRTIGIDCTDCVNILFSFFNITVNKTSVGK